MVRIRYWILILFIFSSPLQSSPQAIDYESIGWIDNLIRDTPEFGNTTPENYKKSNFNNYLIFHTYYGNYQLVSYLLRKGADPSSILSDDNYNISYSALIVASAKGYKNIAELLIKYGANVNYKSNDGNTALIQAAKKNHYDIAELLIKNGADVNITTFSGYSALFESVLQINDSIVGLLIKNRAEVNITDYNGFSPLQYSTGYSLLYSELAGEKHVGLDTFIYLSSANKISEQLIKAGANFEIVDYYGFTPLLVATQLNNIPLVKILCKAGANVNSKSTDGISALMFASDNGYYEIAKTLIDFGVKVNTTAPDGNSAVFAAVRANNDSITELLIKQKAIINASNSSKIYPLHYAAGYGYPYMTNLLLSNGASSNLTDLNGNTPLMASVYSGAIGATKILIDSGADVNLSDIDGNTPLMVAAQFNDTTLIKVMHSAGADLNVLNKNRFNALSSALMSKSNEAFKLLVDLGAKIDTSCSKESVYQQAIETKNYEISSYLKAKNLSTKLRMKIGSINFYTGFSTSQNNFMVDLGGGIYEPISNIIMNIGYKYNPYSNRVVVLKNSSFYQFWEKRYSFYLSLQHLHVIKKNWLRGNIGFTPGISNELTWNKYRGVKNGSGIKWILVPSAGLYYQRNILTIIGKWEFAKYNKEITGSNRFNLQLLFSITTSKRFVNKKINWLD